MATTTDTLKLVSQDGVELEVKRSAIVMSVTIKNILDDVEAMESLPLPTVRSDILQKVIDYVTYHSTHEDETADVKAKWNKEFVQVDHGVLFEMILAANYLDIKTMLEYGCKTVADLIKGKSPDEIRKMFNIVNDFTPEEEARVRKELEWCEDR